MEVYKKSLQLAAISGFGILQAFGTNKFTYGFHPQVTLVVEDSSPYGRVEPVGGTKSECAFMIEIISDAC